jgi:dynein heavy chain
MDISFIGACSSPGGGRNILSTRFYRHFNIVQVPELAKSTLEQIYSCIMKSYIQEQNLEKYGNVIS